MRDLVLDVRAALRRLARSPGYAAAAILTLGLGIGPNAAIFSVVDTVLLRPLPYREPGKIAWVWGTSPTSQTERVSPPDVLDYAATCKGLERVAGFWSTTADLYSASEPERVPMAAVTSGFFEVLGVQPVLGRTFLPSEYSGGNEHVAVLSYNLWQQRFGGDPNVIGKSLTMPLGKHEVYTIVGVMPADFGLLPDVRRPSQRHALWVPLDLSADNMKVRRFRLLRAIARISGETTMAAAQAEMQSVASQLERRFPESNRGWGVRLVPIQDEMLSGSRRSIGLLGAAAALLLLVACANFANLMIVRALGDERDATIRLALGARTRDVLRHALLPQSILALCGGLLGTLLAAISTRLCLVFAPSSIPRLNEVGITLRVAGFAMVLALATTVLFGLLPYLFLLRTQPGGLLGQRGAGLSPAGSRKHLMGFLMVAEIGLTVLLVTEASFAFISLSRLLEVDPGFDTHGLLTMRFDLPTSAGQATVRSELVREVEALPGVVSAATGGRLPFEEAVGSLSFSRADSGTGSEGRASGFYRVVSPSYFQTMKIPLLKGRGFSAEDTASSFPVAIISDSVARRVFRGEDPIGKRLTIEAFRPFTVQVMGVVGSIRETALNSEVGDALYVPCSQQSERRISLVVRLKGDPEGATSIVTHAVRRTAGNVSIYGVRTMDQIVNETLVFHRFILRLLMTLGALALGLASVGVYGVVSHWVVQRRHEIGIRMALGASPGDIARWLLARCAVFLAVGLSIGMLVAMAASRVVSHLIADVDSGGVLSVALPLLAVGFSALAACCIPAAVAARLAPMAVLADVEN